MPTSSNSTDATVTAYSMSSGVLTRIGSYATGLQPVAIGIDPSTNHFLFTVNFLDNNVSDFELSTTAGTLLDAQYSPFATNAQPVAAAAIPHNGTGGGIRCSETCNRPARARGPVLAIPRTRLLQ